MNITIKNITILILILLTYKVAGQQVSLKLGPNKISKNTYFVITASITNEDIKSISDFPEIAGFEKAHLQPGSFMEITNGVSKRGNSLAQHYIPKKDGVFKLDPFTIKINNKSVSSNGTSLFVDDKYQQKDPFEEMFESFGSIFSNRQRPSAEPRDFIEIEDHAFFEISADKNEVFLGEGVTISATFYKVVEDRAEIQFHDTERQLNEMLTLIRPKNAWEEENTRSWEELVEINGKQCIKFDLLKYTFFPLETQVFEIPSYGLKNIKYKEAKNKQSHLQNYMEAYKTYYSRPVKVVVKPLPDHPLKNQVSVGNFRLEEQLQGGNYETGNSINFQFSIAGRGNIHGINPPVIPEDSILQIYPPEKKLESINAAGGMVTGQKMYRYYIVPNEPGTIDLGNYFQWIYFDPDRERYDTLKSQKVIQVNGVSQQDALIGMNDPGTFYNQIELMDDEPVDLDASRRDLLWVQIIMGMIIMSTFGLLFYQKRKGINNRE